MGYQLQLEGVSCNGCVNKIRKALQLQDAQLQLEVDLDTKRATIESALSQQELIDLIEGLGYQAQPLASCCSKSSDVEPAPSSYQLQLQGVRCNGCVNKIRRALEPLDPQLQLDVDLEAQRAEISSTASLEAISAKIAELGYDGQPAEDDSSRSAGSQAEPDAELAVKPDLSSLTTAPLQLALSGLTCAACVASVEKALSGLDEVESVSINFANRTALIHGTVKPDNAIEAIEAAGYGASELVDPGQAEQQREQQRLLELKQKKRASIMALGLGVPMMLYGMVAGMAVETPAQQWGWGIVGLLTLVMMVLAGGHFFGGAWRMLLNRSANMDSLIALGTGSAWLYSMLVVLWPELLPQQSRGLYFEAAALIIGLVNLGQVLELRARGKTQQAIRGLLDLQPKQARVVRDGQELDLPVEQVLVGDLLRVRPGEAIAVDGVVEQGSSRINESMLTGEPVPAAKSEGDELSAGTLNTQGSLLYRATRVGRDTALAKIVELVQQAQGSKPPISQLADRVAAIFVPTVILIALVTALCWWLWGPAPQAVYMLVTSVTVLIIACPCALGLATPISTMIGIGKAAEAGILIRNGDALQRASGLTTLVMDKTGTLTQGRPEVVAFEALQGSEENRLYGVLYAIESRSQHPLAQSISDYCRDHDQQFPVNEFEALDGLGVRAELDGQQWLIGNQRLMEQNRVVLDQVEERAQDWEGQARTVVFVACDQQLVALAAIADPLRTEAAAALQRLRRLGIRLVMLTGDNRRTGKAMADQLQLDHFEAELLPADKLEHIQRLQDQGEQVGMVGDGINDAPALSQADVGFAIGSGTDVAIESADVALMHDSLHSLADAIELSRATLTNIKQNLWGAFIYNSIGIPVAAGVLFPLTGMLLNPVIAATAMSLSSVTVVSNANRLRRFKLLARG